MNPFEAAAGVESVAGFTNDLAAHLQAGGLVLSTPEVFIMLRPVRSDALVDHLCNPWFRWPEPCDAWFVWVLAGDGTAALDLLVPRFGRKKWLAFQTDGPPRFVRLSLVERLWRKARTTPKQSNSRRLP